MTLKIKRTAVSFEPDEVMEIERIMMDADEKGALEFLRKGVYAKMVASQKAGLHSHDVNPAKPFDHMKNK